MDYIKKKQLLLEVYNKEPKLQGYIQSELRDIIPDNEFIGIQSELIKEGFIIMGTVPISGNRTMSDYVITLKGKSFLKLGGFVKEKEDLENEKQYRQSEKRYNINTRWVVFGIGILSVLASFGFGFYSCLNDPSKALLPEINYLKTEVNKLKESVDSLSGQQKAR